MLFAQKVPFVLQAWVSAVYGESILRGLVMLNGQYGQAVIHELYTNYKITGKLIRLYG